VSDAAELALRAALIGAGATALSDLWGMASPRWRRRSSSGWGFTFRR
jgi:hypothetical protein